MQRSFMLTLLQEISLSGEVDAPTLVLAIEEPELYQHPPQSRYLAELLHDLTGDSSQVIVCSHSPLFIPGDDFETVRVVRDFGSPSCSSVSRLSYSKLSKTLENSGQKLLKEKGMLAKLYPSLNPSINEMFFCRVLFLVEGIEDVAHISSYLSLQGVMSDFRRYGCHIVAVGGKSELIKPAAMAKQLDIPVFIVADADTDVTNEKHVPLHKRDNKALLSLMGYEDEDEWPSDHIIKDDFSLWSNNLTKTVEIEIGEKWAEHKNSAASDYGHPGNMTKNPLAISRAHEKAWAAGDVSESLKSLADRMISFADNASRGV